MPRQAPVVAGAEVEEETGEGSREEHAHLRPHHTLGGALLSLASFSFFSKSTRTAFALLCFLFWLGSERLMFTKNNSIVWAIFFMLAFCLGRVYWSVFYQEMRGGTGEYRYIAY